MLQSWEDRFGARPLQVRLDEIRLPTERPPRTPQAAQHVAAEHFASGDGGTNRTYQAFIIITNNGTSARAFEVTMMAQDD